MTESQEPDERTSRPSPEDESPASVEPAKNGDVDAGAGAGETDGAQLGEAPRSQPARRRRRVSRGARAGVPSVALLLLLAAASFVPGIALPATGSDAAAVSDLDAVVAGLRGGAPVLVDIDGDLGTYPEIRYATRAALADLLGHGADLAVVSFSAEGRAIAVAEIARLRDLGVGADRLLDLGFRSGGEPALVQLAGSGIGPGPAGTLADTVRRGGPGTFRLALVIGGADIGPRSWIEQVQPRLPDLPIAAITPSFLLPEVLPYRRSGQLIALVGTLPADLAYGQQVAARAATSGPGSFTDRAPSSSAIVLGMVVAIAVLLAASGGSLAAWVRGAWRRSRS